MLSPLWRCEPNHATGVFAIALDPQEARFVLERGWASLDGFRYRVSLKGCDGEVDRDGRVMVRCEIDEVVDAERLLKPDSALKEARGSISTN